MAKVDVSDVEEWRLLGERLANSSPEKFSELIESLRVIVAAREYLATVDWSLERPPGVVDIPGEIVPRFKN